MQKIIVLDFSTAEVHIYTYNANKKEAEDVLAENNHRESECQWMICDEIKLLIH